VGEDDNVGGRLGNGDCGDGVLGSAAGSVAGDVQDIKAKAAKRRVNLHIFKGCKEIGFIKKLLEIHNDY